MASLAPFNMCRFWDLLCPQTVKRSQFETQRSTGMQNLYALQQILDACDLQTPVYGVIALERRTF